MTSVCLRELRGGAFVLGAAVALRRPPLALEATGGGDDQHADPRDDVGKSIVRFDGFGYDGAADSYREARVTDREQVVVRDPELDMLAPRRQAYEQNAPQSAALNYFTVTTTSV